MNLCINNLGKQYSNGVWGLYEIDLTLEPGLWGIVGPAGAGKTTLLRLLAMVTPPTKGTITWEDEQIQPGKIKNLAKLGYLPQHLGVYKNLSGRAFLRYFAALKRLGRSGPARVEKVLEQLSLTGLADKKMRRYTRAEQRRIGLAQALLNSPRLLLIDEPGETLTPPEQAEFCTLIGQLAQGMTLIATDNIADLAAMEKTSSFSTAKILLLNKGRLILQTTPAQFVQSVQNQVWQAVVDKDALVELKRRYVISHTERSGKQTKLRILSDKKPYLEKNEFFPVEMVSPTLEDAYTYYLQQ